MGLRQGTLLEKNVERIFRLGGFRTKRNAIMNGYEIDVLAKYGDLTIIIQCKQYEKSYVNVKDILHQWESKNKELNADKVIIVIFGQECSREERLLAKNLGLILWDERDVDMMDDIVAERGLKASEEILKEIGLSDNSYKKLKEEFIKLYITPEELSKRLNEKIKIKNIKTDITCSPILSLKLLLKSNKGDFSLEKEFSIFVNLEDKKIVSIPELKITPENITSVKIDKSKNNKINLEISDVEKFAINEFLAKLKSKYYFSSLKNKFPELEGKYTTTESEIYDMVRDSWSFEIDNKIDEIKARYEPRIEDLDNNIANLNNDISHLETEKSGLKGFWGFKGGTETEKKRNRQHFESINRKQEWKRVKISQLDSKRSLTNKRMREDINIIEERYKRLIDNSIEEFNFEPEGDDISIKEKKLIWFPTLKGEAITTDNLKIPIKIEYDEIEKIGECHSCNSNFKNTDSIRLCSLCKNIFCQEHILKCKKCNTEICKEDSWKCNLCDNIYCKNEKKTSCNFCNDKFCKDCIDKCAICNKSFCKSDLSKCSHCKKNICSKDSKKCHICKKNFCSECLLKCEGCKKEVCKDELIKCPNCNKKVCNNCIRYKRKFLVMKEQRCVFCIDKK